VNSPGFGGLVFLLGRGECVGPESVEVVAKRGKPLRIDRIDAPSAVGAIGDEVCGLEDAQMLRHGRSTDGQRAREDADGLRAGKEALDDHASHRIAKGVELF
jgi:hypothetical protein